MGYETGADDDDVVVITEATIVQKIRDAGCGVSEGDDMASWAVSKNGDTIAFLPRALIEDGYTQAQLDIIDSVLSDCGIDLFLDRSRMH